MIGFNSVGRGAFVSNTHLMVRSAMNQRGVCQRFQPLIFRALSSYRDDQDKMQQLKNRTVVTENTPERVGCPIYPYVVFGLVGAFLKQAHDRLDEEIPEEISGLPLSV